MNSNNPVGLICSHLLFMKNKGGRPKVRAVDKKKYRLPAVKLGTADYYSVLARARDAGVSVTEYQRQCILSGAVVERVSAEHLDLYHKLAGIANNLNQLAHQANTYGYAIDANLYHTNAMHVRNIIDMILNDSKDH